MVGMRGLNGGGGNDTTAYILNLNSHWLKCFRWDHWSLTAQNYGLHCNGNCICKKNCRRNFSSRRKVSDQVNDELNPKLSWYSDFHIFKYKWWLSFHFHTCKYCDTIGFRLNCLRWFALLWWRYITYQHVIIIVPNNDCATWLQQKIA